MPGCGRLTGVTRILLSEPVWMQVYRMCVHRVIYACFLCTCLEYLITWHPVGTLKWQSEVGPEVREQCHLLQEKIDCLCLFPLRACCIYYGDLAGFVPQLGQPSCSHRSLQRLPVHTEWIKPRALHEYHGKNPKPCRLSTSAKVHGHTYEAGKAPVTPSQLNILPWHNQVCFVKTSNCQTYFIVNNEVFVLVSFSLSPLREVEHNGGSAQSWEQDTFSLGFRGLGTWKMPEPKQTQKPIQILHCSFSAVIKHVMSYHLIG